MIKDLFALFLNYLYLNSEFDKPVALLFAALYGGRHLHQNVGVTDNFFFVGPEIRHRAVAGTHDGLEVPVRRRRLEGRAGFFLVQPEKNSRSSKLKNLETQEKNSKLKPKFQFSGIFR